MITLINEALTLFPADFWAFAFTSVVDVDFHWFAADNWTHLLEGIIFHTSTLTSDLRSQ